MGADSLAFCYRIRFKSIVRTWNKSCTIRTKISAEHGWKTGDALLAVSVQHVLTAKRYPGCACDVPSHAYTMNFALYPDWPRFFSYSPDIWAYLDKICEVFDLRRYMTFKTQVVKAEWHDDVGKWKVKLRQTRPDGSVKEFDDEGDALMYATGVLNDFQWPGIEGLEGFKGRLVHTARWPGDYQAGEWKEDRVAVIGSGASSIQTVPAMQPHVKHMDIFVRTGVWFVEIADNYGMNHEYSVEEKEKFRRDPEELVKHAKSIENQINGGWDVFYHGSEAQKAARQIFTERMAKFIKDERLLKGFTPQWDIGCKGDMSDKHRWERREN